MSDNNITYDEYPIDTNLLSVLDIMSAGKVVSAADWNTLWQVTIKRLNKVSEFSTRLEALNTAWEINYAAFNKSVEDINKKYDVLEKSFIHYGESEPTDPHTKLWVQPTDYTQVEAELLSGVLSLQLNKAISIGNPTGYVVEQYKADSQNITSISARTPDGITGFSNGNYIIPRGSTITVMYSCTQGTAVAGGVKYTAKAMVFSDIPWILGTNTDYSYGAVQMCGGHYVASVDFTVANNGTVTVEKTLQLKFYKSADVSISKISTVTLKADGWTYIADKNIYSQTISLQNVTPYSKIDLNPSPEQLKDFSNKGYAFVVENKNKVVTVYGVGEEPIHDITIQVTVTEVSR